MEEQRSLREKLAFLRGYTVAPQLSTEEKEIFKKVFDFLEAAVSSIEELNDKTDNLDAVCDYLEGRMETVEDELYSKSEYIGDEKEEV
ncbi:hypothetical protein SAMN04324257_00211 [Thermoanaerobacter thermohydrosulfuricus]|nr:hypothetical protein SAMN04324257_00211 [Thermoanaerobacter thermohydrosulfuricus]